MSTTTDQPAALAKLPLWRGRVLIGLGIVFAAFNLRLAVTSFTPLLETIGADIGFDAAIAGVLGMMPPAAFAVFGILTPLVARRTGLERLALLAMVMAGVGLLARAFVSDALSLVLLSALALGGAGIGNVVIPPLLKRYFADRVATMSTIYVTLLQLGALLPAAIAVPLANELGWRASIGLWSIVAFAAALPWIGVLLSRRGARVRAARAGATADAATGGPATSAVRGSAWRSSLAWGMLGMFSMTSLNTYVVFTWLPAVLSDAGQTPEFGGLMLSLFSVLGLAAALVVPGFASKLSNLFPFVAVSVLFYVAGYAGLFFAPTAAPVLWVLLVGIGPYTFPLSLALINLRTRTPEGSAALSGFTQGVGYLVACLGPLLFGVFREASGGWGLSFALLGVSLVIFVVSAWAACKPRMLEDEWMPRPAVRG
ncbi:MFS transporter [Compostimonas suwonensis]|uniref:CP family cyanate transporter-like MFS transporter n=1 Tax=Compostimonas suwonensis TaxID=1048394 RepID=A0A2M9C4U9_9MICO|nr:MFS transporter [Compostimonas suwonensis]PJJ65553.1 CP family cyanate transporter-like MFS transporter [Compostimonas suwonensis]